MPNVAFALVTLASDTGLRVSAMLDEGNARVMSGYGGWEIVDRPHRIGATNWKGRDPFRLDLPLLFDGWEEGNSIEQDLQTLEMMAGLGGSKPPRISVSGPVPRRDLDWVIEDITWGDQKVIRAPGAGRFRQDVVVHLLQFLSDVQVTEAVTRIGVPSTYTTRSGDTLQKIAIRYYGNKTKWVDIANANDIRDPSNLKPGTVLQLP